MTDDRVPPSSDRRLQLHSALRLTPSTAGAEELGAWFLGPKGENEKVLARLLALAARSHASDRRTLYPDDPKWITDKVRKSPAYTQALDTLYTAFRDMLGTLRQSVPFYSYRYQSHMLWDVTLPSVAGYVAAMLYNQNNVAAEASSVTTVMEIEVANDLLWMLGFPRWDGDRLLDATRAAEPRPWGHLTCGGTVANIESMWAARNLKYYPVALAAAVRDASSPLAAARQLTVHLPDGTESALVELDAWRLLNVGISETLQLPVRLERFFGIGADVLQRALDATSLPSLGAVEFHRRHLGAMPAPVVVGAATMHYSWPKGATLTGIGAANVLHVPVDVECRLDLAALQRTLDRCVTERRPILQVVVILGTTEHSAVDSLTDVLELRERYRRRGVEFAVHVDAAWGGYFASMLRERPWQAPTSGANGAASAAAAAPRAATTVQDAHGAQPYRAEDVMSRHALRQYAVLHHADTVTVDPHKAGYMPYPAGALCYRDAAMRELISLKAPIVYHGEADPSVGLYGIEGSKPGAAAAAALLSHRVIRPDESGYGKILGRTLFNAARFYAAIARMDRTQLKRSDDEETRWRSRFLVAPLHRTPHERGGGRPSDRRRENDHLDQIVKASNDDLLKAMHRDAELQALFRELGGDQNIVPYAFNFFVRRRDPNGRLVWLPNQDVRLLNLLNASIFDRLSVYPGEDAGDVPLIVTASAFDPARHGEAVVRDFLRRLRVDVPDGTPVATPVKYLVSTIANPWLSDTEKGSRIPALVEHLATTVSDEVRRIHDDLDAHEVVVGDAVAARRAGGARGRDCSGGIAKRRAQCDAKIDELVSSYKDNGGPR